MVKKEEKMKKIADSMSLLTKTRILTIYPMFANYNLKPWQN